MSQHPAAAAAFCQEQTVPPTTVGIREQLDATTRAVAAAHEAYLHEALESVQWERRGPLRRLVRRPQLDQEVAEDRVIALRRSLHVPGAS
jgi:hypothetical protein